MDTVAEFSSMKIHGRLQTAKQFFQLQHDGTWNQDALNKITLDLGVGVNQKHKLTGSRSIMVKAKMTHMPQTSVIVKAFPCDEDDANARIESHVSNKIRQILDKEESAFFVLPYGVVTKTYEKKTLMDSDTYTTSGNSVECHVLTTLKDRINKGDCLYAKAMQEYNKHIEQNPTDKKRAIPSRSKFVSDKFAIKYFILEAIYPAMPLYKWWLPGNLFSSLYGDKSPHDNRLAREVIAVFLQIFEAFKTLAHHGITHNDMHWGNVFVQRCNHSFIAGGINVESKYIVKIFDWDRAVCNDTECMKIRDRSSLQRMSPTHVHEYTAGFDLVGFFKSFDSQLYQHVDKVWQDRVTVDERSFYFTTPMRWLLSEMLNPMKDLFNDRPSLAFQGHKHHSNPCLTIPSEGSFGTGGQSPPKNGNKVQQNHGNDYPGNCMKRWPNDMNIPTPENVIHTLTQCLTWARADPLTPDYMINGMHAFYNATFGGDQKFMDLLKEFVPLPQDPSVSGNDSRATVRVQMRSHLNYPAIRVQVKHMRHQTNTDNVIQRDHDYDAMNSILSIIRSEILANGCQYFVFPFAAHCERVPSLGPTQTGIVSDTASTIVQHFARWHNTNQRMNKDTSRLQYIMEEDMASVSTLTLDEWFKHEHRAQSINWLNNGGPEKIWGSVYDDCVKVLIQAVVAIERLDSLRVTHGGLRRIENIFVQRCENSFWVKGTLLSSDYLVKIGGWIEDVDDNGRATSSQKTNMGEFVCALANIN